MCPFVYSRHKPEFKDAKTKAIRSYQKDSEFYTARSFNIWSE